MNMDDKRFLSVCGGEHNSKDDPERGCKLKLHSSKIPKGSSTPVSSLCESLSNASLMTSLRNPSNDNELTIKSCGLHATVSSQFQTPCNNQTPKQRAMTDFITRFKSPFQKEENSTPRRNPRRSCSGRLTTMLGDFEDLEDDGTSQNTCMLVENILQQDSLFTALSDNGKEIDKTSELLDNCQGEGNICSNHVKQIEAPLPQEDFQCDDNSESKSLTEETDKINKLKCPTPSVISSIFMSKTASEPRPRTRKSDIGVSSLHKLRLSVKRSSFRRKNIEEYDPDNDIFAHGLVPTNFNVDSLKDEIGKFLNSPDIPAFNLKRSRSCGTLSDVNSIVEAAVTPSRLSLARRKQFKQVTQTTTKDTVKRSLSAPNLLETVSTDTKLPKEGCKGGSVRAFLHAQNIIMNINKRKPTQDSKPPSEESNSEDCDSSRVGGTSKSFENDEDEKEVHNISFESNYSLSDSEPNNSSDFSLPPTQPFESVILRDVTAYVEVISNNENISAGVRIELMKLGATVVPNFNRDMAVTHVVFNDGHVSTYKKAKKRNIPLVSVLWIEECRKAGVKVHESLYPPYQIERYESPSIVKQLKKRRILHFPSDKHPRPSPRRKKGNLKSVLSPTDDNPEKKLPTYKRSLAPKWVEQVAGDNGMMRILVNMAGIGPGEFKDIVKRPPTPDSEIDSNIDSPLAVRLLRKLAKKSDMPHNDLSKSEKTNICLGVTDIQDNLHREMKEMEKVCASNSQENQVLEESNLNNSPEGSPNPTPTCDPSILLKVSQRKKNKRKLLNTSDDTVLLSDDDTVCQVVPIPHSFTPRHLSIDSKEKKRKLSNSSECCQESVEPDKCDGKSEKFQDINDGPVDPVRRSRRSSMYFVKNEKRSSSPVTQKPAIVCTLLQTVEVEVIASIIEKLGIYVLEKNVTQHTTHVVAGAAKRTMKVLKGMVRGCWIVAQEWVLKSLDSGKWLDEEEFEMTSFSPAVQKYRLEKLSFGAIFKPDIFRSCGPIFVSSKSIAPRGDIVELILLCGGRIASRVSKAEIVVGKSHPGVLCVTALWVFDSITIYSCKPFDSYLCT